MSFRSFAHRALLAALLLSCGAASALANSPPLVSNVVAEQRVGTYLVDISYDVSDADGDLLEVTAFLSIDGGATYPIPLVTATGAIGTGVLSGTGRAIVWDAGVDYPGFIGDECSIRIVANDGQGTPHMLVLFDRSGSMSSGTAGGGTRYDALQNALSTFFNDSGHSGLVVAMNFFPLDSPPDQCDPGLHDPPQVAAGALTGHATTLDAAISAAGIGGAASTHPALDGSLDFLVAHRLANPSDASFAVLITDGPPGDCDVNFASLNALAAAALTNGVRTYVVSVDTDLAGFHALASAGGTGGALVVGGGGNTMLELLNDLELIYGNEVGP